MATGADAGGTTDEMAQIARLRTAIVDLEADIAVEDEAIAALDVEHASAAATFDKMNEECAELTAQLHQRQRTEAHQASTARLLQLQLTVATQIHGVAEQLSHVTAAPPPPVGSKPAAAALMSGGAAAAAMAAGGGGLAEALHLRDKEVAELRRALKRQQLLVADSHRQLLELATRKRPMVAPMQRASDDVGVLRAALSEQDMARKMAEARCDELQAQVRMLEEQKLREKLHHPPPSPHTAAPPRSAHASAHDIDI